MLQPVIRGKFSVRAKKKATPIAPEVIFEGMHKIPELVEALKQNEGRREKEHQEKMHEITEAIANVKKIQRGPKGDTVVPLVGVHFKQPKDGKDADEKGIEERIFGRVSSRIRQPKDGNDAEVDYKKLARMVARRMPKPKQLEQKPPSIKDIVSALKNLPEDERLTLDDLGNSEVKIRKFWERYPRGYVHGSGITSLKAGTDIVITKNSDGSYTISSTGGGGGGGTGSSVSLNPPTTGLVNSSNFTFTYDGLMSLIVVDGDIDIDAVLSFAKGVTTITTSTPPQYSMYVISGNGIILQVPTQSVDSSNRSYQFTGQAWLAIVDGKVDLNATFSFNTATGVTIVTTSTPPQNSILLVGGSGANPQAVTPAPNSSNVTFYASGIVAVAIGDNSVDVDAVLTYNAGTAQTEIVFSVPPQNNAYAF